MQGKLVLLLLATFLATNVTAADASQAPGCHQLLTEKECAEHQARLASLSSGEALARYLAEFESVRKERERFCNCTKVPVGWTRMPQQRHAMLSF